MESIWFLLMSDPFEFDISISADKQRRQKGRRSMTGAVETSSRICDHPNCKRRGRFRAPKSPKQLDDFYWFCQKHVREYNLKWNFFEASDGGQEEAAPTETEEANGSTAEEQRKARQQKAWSRHGIDDPLEILGSKGTRRKRPQDAGLMRLTADERRAVQILDVKPTWSKAEIRHQYTSLVKVYHPDLNGGYREEEDRLRMVIWAWDQIKNSRHFPS